MQAPLRSRAPPDPASAQGLVDRVGRPLRASPRPRRSDRGWRPRPQNRSSLNGVLLGRGDELDSLRDLWMGARAFAGRSLVVSGDPGIGKSALLDAASEAAEGDGLRVLRTRGAASEATLPFAALSALLRPIASRIEGATRRPGRPARWRPRFRRGSAGRPVRGRGGGAQPARNRLERAADLLACDDAHWLDLASFGRSCSSRVASPNRRSASCSRPGRKGLSASWPASRRSAWRPRCRRGVCVAFRAFRERLPRGRRGVDRRDWGEPARAPGSAGRVVRTPARGSRPARRSAAGGGGDECRISTAHGGPARRHTARARRGGRRRAGRGGRAAAGVRGAWDSAWGLGAGGGRRACQGRRCTDRVSPRARSLHARHDAKRHPERRAAHHALAEALGSDVSTEAHGTSRPRLQGPDEARSSGVGGCWQPTAMARSGFSVRPRAR